MINWTQLDQFLLTKSLDRIVQWHKEYEKGKNPYTNLVLVQGDKPDVTLNRILNCNPEVYSFFNNLTTIQKAALMPRIELYYNTPEGYMPIHFRNNPNFNEFQNFASRADKEFNFKENQKEDGVGLKKITITDTNQNPATVNLECKVELYFDSLLALTNSSVLELIRTPEIRQAKSERDFRLKLVCGWQTPVDASNTVFSTKELDLIEKSNTVYLLSIVKHDLSFNQNGSISITIYYQGALEKYLCSSSDMDIFGVSTQGQILKFLVDSTSADKKNAIKLKNYIIAITKKITIEAEIETLSKKKLTSLEKTKINLGQAVGESEPDNEVNKEIDEKIKEKDEKLTEVLKEISDLELYVVKNKYSRFLRALEESQRLFFLPIPSSVYSGLFRNLTGPDSKVWEQIYLSVFNTPESFSKTENKDALYTLERKKYASSLAFMQKINEAEGDEKKLADIDLSVYEWGEDYLAPSFRQTPGLEQKYLIYTTLGDIINITREFIGIEDADNIEILLGPCIAGKFSLNIANFPIALTTFMSWFVNSVVRQAKRKYQFWEFIYDIIGAMVTPALLSTGLLADETLNINLGTAMVISDKKLYKGNSYLDTELLHELSKNVFDTKNVYTYLVLYMKDYEMDKRDGILEQDSKDGIYHFSIGKDRGIVKTVDFSKIDFPRLRDMRLTTEGFNNAGDLLREHYDMTLKTIGSPLFIVGSQIFFDGTYLGETGRNLSEIIGLGGYYLITGLEISVSKEVYEISVKCTWTSMRKTAADALKLITTVKTEDTPNVR